MKNFAKNLNSELKLKLDEIHTNHKNPIEYAELGIKSSIKAIEKLKTFFNTYTFENNAAEIEFFKTIKPQFASKLIYYNEIYNIEISKPSCSEKIVRKHYKTQKSKLLEFQKENAEFYKYYRSKNTSLDKKYFLRRRHDYRLTLDSSYFQSDYNFSTSHDYKIAKIHANEKLHEFLNKKVHKRTVGSKPKHIEKRLNWTAPKVALVELIYALHYQGVFSKGNAELKEIITSFETFLNINLGQYHRVFIEIQNRKSIEKSNFLNALKENLISNIQRFNDKL